MTYVWARIHTWQLSCYMYYFLAIKCRSVLRSSVCKIYPVVTWFALTDNWQWNQLSRRLCIGFRFESIIITPPIFHGLPHWCHLNVVRFFITTLVLAMAGSHLDDRRFGCSATFLASFLAFYISHAILAFGHSRHLHFRD